MIKFGEYVIFEDNNYMEKEKYFNERTNKHIELVKKYAKYIGIDADGHDASKFEEPEHTPYVDITWNKLKGIRGQTPEMIKATEHHIKNNKHHPEYWTDGFSGISRHDRDAVPNEIVDATKMPERYVMEMVADWLGMSEEMGTDVYDWINKNVNKRWKFTPEQVEIINKNVKIGLDKNDKSKI